MYRDRIVCQRIMLVLGNHDNRSGNWSKRWMNLGFEFVTKYPVIYRECFILSHQPIFLATERRTEGIITAQNGNLATSKIPFMCNIHGHLHDLKYTDEKHYINVSVEQTDYKPINLEELCENLIVKYNES